MSLLIQLKRTGSLPLYRQLVDEIRRLIDEGTLKAGDHLPPSRKLAKALAVNRSTVLLAYEELGALGFLDSRQGGYTTVKKRKAEAGYNPERIGAIQWAKTVCQEVEAVYSKSISTASDLVPAGGPRPPLFDLSSIELDPRLYPMSEFRRCLKLTLDEAGSEILRYADPFGYGPLREILAQRLRLHGISVSANDILITNGAQQGLDLITRTLGGPGRTVAAELPTYASILPLFQLNGLRISGIPMKDDGMDMVTLKRVVEQEKPAFIYTMPSFQNPTGLTTAHGHREALLELALQAGVPIIEDGFEDDMKYEGPVPMPIKSIDEHGLVIYVGTFSKALFPGLRIGWIAADRLFVERLAALKRFTDLATNTIGQMVLNCFCRLGFYDRHIQRIHRVFRRRMRTAMDSAERHFPSNVQWTKPVGGYTFWVTLPNTVEPQLLNERAARAGVRVSPGGAYFPDGGASEYIRLSIARLHEEELVAALARLGELLFQLVEG